MDTLNYTYAGTVEATDDPERLGRLKVRVPAVYGPANRYRGSIATNDLPWALPAGMPAGGSPESGAVVWLPAIGDHVFVRFLDGEPEKPIWEWGGQDRSQAAAFPYWRRENGGYEAKNAAPKSALLTRYGHAIDFSPVGLSASAANGYSLQLFAGSAGLDGYALLETGRGFKLELDDASRTGQIYIDNLMTLTKYARHTTNQYILSASTSAVVKTPDFHVQSARVRLGSDATDPVVRKSDLQAALDVVMQWANTHTHGKSPTATPPLVAEAEGSSNTFSR